MDYVQQRYKEDPKYLSVEKQYNFYKALHGMMKRAADYIVEHNQVSDVIKANLGGEEVTLTLGEWRKGYLQDTLDKIQRRIKDLEDNNTTLNTVNKISDDIREKLNKIITTLVSKIEKGEGGRWTSSTEHRKLTELKSIQEKLNRKDFSQEECIEKVMAACAINAIPFTFGQLRIVLKSLKSYYNRITLTYQQKVRA